MLSTLYSPPRVQVLHSSGWLVTMSCNRAAYLKGNRAGGWIVQLHPAGSLALTVGDGVVIDRLHLIDDHLQSSRIQLENSIKQTLTLHSVLSIANTNTLTLTNNRSTVHCMHQPQTLFQCHIRVCLLISL